jgi:hypothetical protein
MNKTESRTGRIGNPGHQANAQDFGISVDLLESYVLFRALDLDSLKGILDYIRTTIFSFE